VAVGRRGMMNCGTKTASSYPDSIFRCERLLKQSFVLQYTQLLVSFESRPNNGLWLFRGSFLRTLSTYASDRNMAGRSDESTIIALPLSILLAHARGRCQLSPFLIHRVNLTQELHIEQTSYIIHDSPSISPRPYFCLPKKRARFLLAVVCHLL